MSGYSLERLSEHDSESAALAIHQVALKMRRADRAECWAFADVEPLEALKLGVLAEGADVRILYRGPEPIGIFGIGPSGIPTIGTVWFLGTEGIERGGRALTRLASKVIHEACESGPWPVLHNYVMEDNIVHVRWLERLGFVIVARHPKWGHARIPFLEFMWSLDLVSSRDDGDEHGNGRGRRRGADGGRRSAAI